MIDLQKMIYDSIPLKREFLLRWLKTHDNEFGEFDKITLNDVRMNIPDQIFTVRQVKYRVYSNVWNQYVVGLA